MGMIALISVACVAEPPPPVEPDPSPIVDAEPKEPPPPELPMPHVPDDPCDGIDNDVDGDVDEHCYCTVGETQPCFRGPADAVDVGACRAGIQYCEHTNSDLGYGLWGACISDIVPQTEICESGIDEDCDGVDAMCVEDPVG